MQNSEVSKINKVSWEKTAEVHRKLKMDELLSKFKSPGYSLLDTYETTFLLDKIHVEGKDVIQLCCNNARELLSIKNLGANRCVGVDITEGFIQQGKELAEAANQSMELHSMDVYDIPDSWNNSFDVVYITVGAICWLQDLNKFMALISKLLRTDGFLLLYEMHPILEMFEPSSDQPIIPQFSYFRTEPYIEEEGFDYYDPTQKIDSTSINFQHTLEEIMMDCISNGLIIREFREYPHDISNVFKKYEAYRFPMSYIVLAQKVG